MKKALLLAGGGTLGTYASEELLKDGYKVDVVCLEDRESSNENLRFFKAYADEKFLNELFADNYYDVMINFVHYTSAEDYKKIYPLLIKNTDHLTFLSSYRVYADKETPIKETSPRLADVLDDKDFFATEDYALPKSICEDFLKNECAGDNWTVVRPVISFSERRFDLFTYVFSLEELMEKINNGEEALLPEYAKNLTAGIDWAGNSGRLIAKIASDKNTLRECYTISTGQNLTWEEVAKMYTELAGLKVQWVDEDTFLAANPRYKNEWRYIYDRKFDRAIDASKVLLATGLKKEDFLPIRKGLEIEFEKVGLNETELA